MVVAKARTKAGIGKPVSNHAPPRPRFDISRLIGPIRPFVRAVLVRSPSCRELTESALSDLSANQEPGAPEAQPADPEHHERAAGVLLPDRASLPGQHGLRRIRSEVPHLHRVSRSGPGEPPEEVGLELDGLTLLRFGVGSWGEHSGLGPATPLAPPPAVS